MSPSYIHRNPRYSTPQQLQQQQQQRRASAGPLGQPADRSSSMGETTTTVSSTSRESVISPAPALVLASHTRRSSAGVNPGQVLGLAASSSQSHNATLARYSNTSTYSMSKSVSTGTDLSDDIADNIIYSDINDLYRRKQHQQQQRSVQIAVTGATSGDGSASAAEDEEEIMDEVIDENTIRQTYLDDDDLDDEDEIDIRYATATQIKAMVTGVPATTTSATSTRIPWPAPRNLQT